MLGADPDWIRETQQQVLLAEDWKVEKVAERVQRLADDFPEANVLSALTTMRDELNQSAEGRNTTTGLADRMIKVSDGLGEKPGDWIRAVAGRKEQPKPWLLRGARWLTEPARSALWERLVRSPKLTPAKRPLIFKRWLPLAAIGLGAALLVVAGVVDVAAIRIIAALVAGLVLAAGVALGVVILYVERVRNWVQKRIAATIPEINPESRNQ
jgi:hypothetical protein